MSSYDGDFLSPIEQGIKRGITDVSKAFALPVKTLLTAVTDPAGDLIGKTGEGLGKAGAGLSASLIPIAVVAVVVAGIFYAPQIKMLLKKRS
jgi:hypothetical protein